MTISATQVKDLREKTGAAMMDCKRALEEAGGVERRAAELLGYRHYQTLAAQLERLGLP